MDNLFESKKVAITGKFTALKRGEIELRLVALGASITKSISAKTDILVVGEKAGSKLQKAKALNLQIIDEGALVLEFGKIDNSKLEAVTKDAQKKANTATTTKVLDEEIANYITQDKEKNGLTLAQRLKLYFTLLGQRSDIYIHGNWSGGKPLAKAFGKAASVSSLNRWKGKLPLEYLAFLTEMGTFDFGWSFRALSPQLIKDDYFEQGEPCALLHFRGVSRSPKWYPRPDYDDEYNYVARLMIDEMVAEGYTEYSYDEGETKTDAKLIFVNHNDCDRSYMGSLESYFTEGAKNAFVWYWQCQSWTGQHALEELRKNSIPATSSKEEILNRFITKGYTKEEAEALHQWLGKDVVLLLEQD
ncbi:BRCT domain-containing protein [Aureispira anguillae]|uniref:BRCT domain-containing protein n=1 Tax=Aureispira anguillae TaxID=2864201 RepID=A0A915YGP3_9BACT|nr:BRCT domain-containing protein [Aureispira anguillae]BDS12633.1 hypothetical protein AsAng_0033570 [Aureispira anguillae]